MPFLMNRKKEKEAPFDRLTIVDVMQAFYPMVQTGVLAVCFPQTYSSCSYYYTLCERKIWRWKFQPNAVLSVPDHHLHYLLLSGTLCPGIVLYGLPGSASTIQSSSKVYYNQVCSFPYILAGMILVINQIYSTYWHYLDYCNSWALLDFHVIALWIYCPLNLCNIEISSVKVPE